MADRPGHSYEDTMRNHDAAFMGWLGGLHVDYGSAGLGIEDALNSPIAVQDRSDFPILRVFSTPQKLFARVADLLVYTGWIQTSDPKATAAVLRDKAREDFQVLPLPIATVIREDPVERIEDGGVPKVFGKQCFDEANLAYQTQRWPAPYDINYRVIIWSIKRYTQEFVREWIMSQVGRVGVGLSERQIPVNHLAPWGIINQTLSFEGQVDQSDLENDTESDRELRTEYSFRLKAWLFKRPEPVSGVDPSAPGYAEGQVGAVQGINIQEAVFDPNAPLGSSIDPEDFAAPSSLVTAAATSGNYFSFFKLDTSIPTQWPKAGIATVRRGGRSPLGRAPHPTLRITTTDPADEVLLSNFVTPLDPDGLAVLTLAFDYASDAVAQIIAAQKAAGAGMPFANTYIQSLPVNGPWTHGQFFLLMDESTFSVSVAGTGVAAVLDISQINLRHIRSPAVKTLPDSSTPGGGVTTHAFSGLLDRPYLFVAQWATPTGSGTIDVDGEIYAGVDPLEQTVGFVAVFTPSTGGVASIVTPDALPTAMVYVQEYLGPWNGTSV